jgi:hypothetical protein
MPTVLRVSGFRFFFYSLENAEPAHIHVEHGDRVAQVLAEPCQSGRIAWFSIVRDCGGCVHWSLSIA